MSDITTFLARAAEARADAETATLDNVRDRCLRAEAAWMVMADRARRTERLRAEQIAAKAAQANSADSPELE